MPNINWRFWQDQFKLLVDRGDGTYAERVEAYPPSVLMTDRDGPNARLRVDPAQTSFFAGKEFRTVQDFTIPQGGMVTIRATVGTNIILHSTSLSVEAGVMRMSLYAGGTANGPWVAMPVYRKNGMTNAPIYAPNVTMDYDGAHTGGTRLDVAVLAAGKSATVGSEQSSERGVPPGTYYYRLENLSNQSVNCVFSGWWEERV